MSTAMMNGDSSSYSMPVNAHVMENTTQLHKNTKLFFIVDRQ